MGDKSKIEWTDATWNPVTGCSKVSEGCRNCYAERVAHRFVRVGTLARKGLANYDTMDFTDVLLHPDRLDQPLRWKSPRRIFVDSMSDLFHESVPDSFIEEVWAVMLAAPHHTFQVLTKRPKQMDQFLTSQDWERVGKLVVDHSREAAVIGLQRKWRGEKMFQHVWLGVSCEDQKTADERIPILLQTPAAVRWISAEPLLGPMDLSPWINPVSQVFGTLTQQPEAISWVVVGGESGPKARPMHPDWARSIRDQCQAAGVPFFFKQWGEWTPNQSHDGLLHLPSQQILMSENGRIERHVKGYKNLPEGPSSATYMIKVPKKLAGRMLDGREWSAFPNERS